MTVIQSRKTFVLITSKCSLLEDLVELGVILEKEAGGIRLKVVK